MIQSHQEELIKNIRSLKGTIAKIENELQPEQGVFKEGDECKRKDGDRWFPVPKHWVGYRVNINYETRPIQVAPEVGEDYELIGDTTPFKQDEFIEKYKNEAIDIASEPMDCRDMIKWQTESSITKVHDNPEEWFTNSGYNQCLKDLAAKGIIKI